MYVHMCSVCMLGACACLHACLCSDEDGRALGLRTMTQDSVSIWDCGWASGFPTGAGAAEQAELLHMLSRRANPQTLGQGSHVNCLNDV